MLKLYNNTAIYLYYVGLIDQSLQKYKALEKLAIKYNDKVFQSKAKFGQVEYLLDIGKKEEAFTLMHQIERELEGTNLIDPKSIIYNKLATAYRDNGEHRKAINYLETSNNLYPKGTFNRKIFANYSSLGRIFRFMGDNDSAKINYKKAEKIAIQLKDEQALSTILNNLGNIDHMAGNYDNAIEHYMRSLSLKEKFGNQRGTAIALHNIGAIKYDMKSYDDAIIDFEKSNEIGRKVNFKPIIVYNKQKIGNCFREKSDVPKALALHQEALEISKEIEFTNGILEALQNIGDDYIKLNNYQEANKHLLEGLALSKKVGSKPFESSILVLISKSYLQDNKRLSHENKKLADNTGLNDQNAESYLLRAKELADEMNNVDNKKLALEGLNLLYTKTKKNKENVAILQEQLALKDSIFLKERTEAIADWETKYETAEKEKEIIHLEIAQKESKARIQFWSIISLLLLLIIGIGVYLYLQLKEARKKLQDQNDELIELNQTKDKFFGIIAHDIRSPIVALESVDEQMDYYLKKNNLDKLTDIGGLVGKTARHLHSLLDNLLNWALIQTHSIPFNPEYISPAETVNEIIDLMQANLTLKNQKVISHIEPNLIINADFASISTIFRNLISNALKYSASGSHVELDHYVENNMNYFTVKDYGVGIKEATLKKLFTLEKKSKKGTQGEKGTGLGLILCKELVELHGGEIKIESEFEKGTTISFGIPI